MESPEIDLGAGRDIAERYIKLPVVARPCARDVRLAGTTDDLSPLIAGIGRIAIRFEVPGQVADAGHVGRETIVLLEGILVRCHHRGGEAPLDEVVLMDDDRAFLGDGQDCLDVLLRVEETDGSGPRGFHLIGRADQGEVGPIDQGACGE